MNYKMTQIEVNKEELILFINRFFMLKKHWDDQDFRGSDSEIYVQNVTKNERIGSLKIKNMV